MSVEEPIVDALAYIDQDLDEHGVRETVSKLIEEEKRSYRPTKNYLEHLPPLNLTVFETPLMRAEFERIANRQPMDMLSMKRYELPPPPTGKLNDVQAWTECVDNSIAQLEHQSIRIMNIEIMTDKSSTAWQVYNETLVKMLSTLQRKLQKMRELIQDVNYGRKSKQLKVGETLKELQSQWVGLISKNYEIELAITNMEDQLSQNGVTPETWKEDENDVVPSEAAIRDIDMDTGEPEPSVTSRGEPGPHVEPDSTS